MKLVYFILIHKNPNQVKLLIDQLTTSSTEFILHVDLKADLNAFKSILYGKHIHYLTNRVNVNWGGFSMVDAINEGMIFAINNLKFNRFIYITGQDFPIKSNKFLLNYFAENPTLNLINGFKLPDEQWADCGVSRITNFSFSDIKFSIVRKILNRTFSVFNIKRKFNIGFDWFGGTAYFAISYELAREIITDLNGMAKKIKKHLKYAYCPDEIYFNTLFHNILGIKNSAFNFHLIKWPREGRHPLILQATDIDEIFNSDKLFARKFDLEVDGEIINLVKKTINNE